MKNKKYHTVKTVLKYHIVGTILKYHAVRTVLKYHTVGTVLKYHTVGTVLKYHIVGTVLKYHTVRTVLKSNIKTVKMAKLIALTQIHDHLLSCLGTGTSIKIAGRKADHPACLCNLFTYECHNHVVSV